MIAGDIKGDYNVERVKYATLCLHWLEDDSL